MGARAEVEKVMKKMLKGFDYMDVKEIPQIDLYMDQVLTFMGEHLRSTTRNPDTDKILTKAMVNNYVKNKVIIPPVKKKYGTDHVLLLTVVYYMKNFLTIDDIRRIITPVSDRYARPSTYSVEPHGGKRRRYTLSDIYTEVFDDVQKSTDHLADEVRAKLDIAEKSFADAPEADRDMLQRFDLICQLCGDIYVRKLLIEKLIDEVCTEVEPEKTSKKNEHR